MLEQKIQKKIITQLEANGFFVVKLIKTNKNGIPDLLAVKKNRTIFVEVKQEHGKLSEIQRFRINELRAKGIEVFVWIEYNKNFDKLDNYYYEK